MLASIVATSLRLAARWGVRILAAVVVAGAAGTVVGLLLAMVGVTLVGGSLEAAFDGTATGVDVARLLTIAVPVYGLLLVVQSWTQLVAVRAASGRHRLVGSLTEAIPGALRSLPLLALLAALQLLLLIVDPTGVAALVVLVVLLVPVLVAVGTLALEPGRWGLDAFVRLGLLRVHRHVGATIAALLVLAFALTIAAMLAAAAFTLLVGPVPFTRLGSADALEEYLGEAPPALALVAWLVAALPVVLLVPSLVVATWQVVREGPTARGNDEDEDAVVPEDDISPAVRQLLGTPAVRSHRLVVPPRADHDGRVPGPGVLQVAGVDLPPGRHTRPVRATTLELDARDARPGDDPARDDRLWVASRPSDDAPTTWKRLAAGFSETGLWPLLLPGDHVGAREWFDEPGSELPPREGIRASDVVRARLATSLPGSPLAATGRLARTGAARGNLTRGSGRRADALARAAAAVGPARLALAPGRRPADVLARLAWPGADAAGIPTDELVELLASWEARWGALLVALDVGALTFAVLRPPATVDEALEALAEQHALCPDEAHGWRDEEQAATQLVEGPVWRLSWR